LRYIDLPLLMGGRFAVMLFFVLSGFVLALPYFAGTSAAYGPYLVRRFCRLYPPFAFAVLVSALLCYLLGGVALPGLSDWLTEAWGFACNVRRSCVASVYDRNSSERHQA
jgi:peptidoglycan/LPS O-acetylase OafA/YrhL